MATKSGIEWTEYTWNPVTGCTKISHGCKNCYALRMSKRLKAMGVRKYANGFDLTLHEAVLSEPLRWKKPRIVFVNSMSDMFHEDVPDDFILRAFAVMRQASMHIFQVLTKRAERIVAMNEQIDWPSNVWMGVSVEDNAQVRRAELLKQTNAKVKFLSLEPLLGPLPDLNVNGIDWAIVGGESGPGARPMLKPWVVQIRNKCHVSDVPFFFKQWGGVNKKRTGRELDGRTWDSMPRARNQHMRQFAFA